MKKKNKVTPVAASTVEHQLEDHENRLLSIEENVASLVNHVEALPSPILLTPASRLTWGYCLILFLVFLVLPLFLHGIKPIAETPLIPIIPGGVFMGLVLFQSVVLSSVVWRFAQ